MPYGTAFSTLPQSPTQAASLFDPAALYSRKDPGRKAQALSDWLNVGGGQAFAQGTQAMQQPLSYFQGLLGSRQEALQSEAPEIASIQGQAKTAAEAVSKFAPRGGGRVQQSAEQPFATAAAIQGLISRVRPQAAQAEADIGTRLAGLGIGEQSIATNLLNIATNYSLTEQQRNDAIWGSIGQSVGQLLPDIIGAVTGG